MHCNYDRYVHTLHIYIHIVTYIGICGHCMYLCIYNIYNIYLCIAIKQSSKTGNAVMNNFLVTGILNWFCQVADNLVFYYGYKAATNDVPKWKTICVFTYIAIVMSASWLPTFTINPFYADTSSLNYIKYYYTPGQLIYTWGNVLYNALFTIEFVKILYKVHIQKCSQYSKPARIISMKCCIHFFSRYSYN